MKPRPDTHWSRWSFIAIDVEGNGQAQQEIIEVALVHVSDCQVTLAHEWLVKPAKSVTAQASKLHGILNEDLAMKPVFEQILPEVSSVLDDLPVIGHNVSVDVRLLKEKIPTWQPLVAIDTMRLARRVRPSASSFGLDALLVEFGIKRKSGGVAHRAASDALAAAELFLAIASLLDQRGDMSLQTLAESAASPDDSFFKLPQQGLF